MFSLEDPVHPLLGPTLWGLHYFVACPSNKVKLRVIHYTLYFLTIFMALTEFVELYRIRSDLAAALRNLSLTILAYVTMVKIGGFYFWRKDWMVVMRYVSSLEKYQLKQGDQATKDIIKKYTKYSRRVTYCYWSMVTASVTIYSFAPLMFYLYSVHISKTINGEEIPYPEIISTWVPFDKTRGYKYVLNTSLKIFMAFYSAAAFGVYDANVVVLMSFFVGQLDILKLNCGRLFGNGEVTIGYKEVIKNIRKCHHHHILLVRNSKLLNSLLSPVMFLYIIVCSVMMCCNAVQLSMKEATIMEKAWVAEYLAAQIFQLFLFCWHGQKVLDMSRRVDEGVYSSAWWSQEVRINRHVILLGGQLNKSIVFTAGPFTDLNVVTFVASRRVDEGVYFSAWWSQEVRINRHVILLGGQLNKSIVFTAGPFTDLNVVTFVAILKGTYSYYTLLSNVGE